MEEWSLLQCLDCNFPYLVPAKEYIELINGDSPFMTCPKCGSNQNVSRDAFKYHVNIPLKVKKVTRYIITEK
ncbi:MULTISPECIES: hypothetical protein [unclassified Clostridium]|uniref:hypothetical protein n=1 Tax=unclassified Clostridium TaxID=2614128 RepID=UPI0025C697D5|nr:MULTISPECIES: hypothetical protein [unclassified Clostridium]